LIEKNGKAKEYSEKNGGDDLKREIPRLHLPISSALLWGMLWFGAGILVGIALSAILAVRF
jgi:hypothetical protein